MRRAGPVIGVCAAVEEASWGVWRAVCNLTPLNYSREIQRAGGIAILLPPDDRMEEAPDGLLDLIDGLMLAGGSDVDAGSYGAAPHPETRGTRPERDRLELALARRALDRDMPLLAICRGMQVLNVALGGTLVQHLPETLDHDRHRETPGSFTEHTIRLERGSLAARAGGGDSTSGKSHHHQGVDVLGEALVATGWSESDGLVEAVELPERRFALGVLWHPEEDERSGVIRTFVEEAGRSRGS
ncbi:MAG: gamma-glutamyl-gamma-aminobutyrate hydrolase family protein [Solirubrobacterales bacterium]|nr:gamma-glutamyl-gamma-aminobutyrate hydrolase family protein [Solirubrobacterales bacterium]